MESPSAMISRLQGAGEAELKDQLELFCTYLCFGDGDYFAEFPGHEGIDAVLTIMRANMTKEDITVLCWRAIALITEHLPNAHEIATQIGVPQQTVPMLESPISQEVVEEVLKVLKHLSHGNVKVLLECGVIPAVVRSMQSVHLQDKHLHTTSLEILENIVSKLGAHSSGPGGAKGRPGGKRGKKPPGGEAPSPGAQGNLADAVTKEIIPALQRLLDSLLVEDSIDAGVGTAMVGLVASLADRCRLHAPAALAALTGSCVAQLCKLLVTASLQGDTKLVCAALRAVAVLSSVAPAGVAESAAREPALLSALARILHPDEADFADVFKDPFGLAAESAETTGEPMQHALYIAHSLAPPLPSDAVSLPQGELRRQHQWEWADDLNEFSPYSGGDQAALEDALQEGKPTLPVAGKYVANLTDMTQGTQGSGRSRAIRRFPLPTRYRRLQAPAAAAAGPAPSKSEPKLRRKGGSQKAAAPPSGSRVVLDGVAASFRGAAAGSLQAYYVSPRGAEVAAILWQHLCAPLSHLCISGGSTQRKLLVSEALTRLAYATVGAASVAGEKVLASVREPLERHGQTVVDALVTTVAQSGGAAGEHALLSAEVLAAAAPGGGSFLAALRRARLGDCLGTGNKLPPAAVQRAEALLRGPAAPTGVHADTAKLRSVGEQVAGPGGFGALFQFAESGAAESDGLGDGSVISYVVDHLRGKTAPRREVLTDLYSAIVRCPKGGAGLCRALAAFIAQNERLAEVERSQRVSTGSPPKRQRGGSTGKGGDASEAGGRKPPPLAATSIIRALSEPTRVRFTPTPFPSGEDSIVEADPLATIGCLERFLGQSLRQGAKPQRMQQLVLSRPFPGAEGLAGGLPPEVLEQLMAAGIGSDIVRVVIDEDSRSGGDGEGDSGDDDDHMAGGIMAVRTGDSTGGKIYDNARKPKVPADKEEPTLERGKRYTLSLRVPGGAETVPLPPSSTIIDAIRTYARHSGDDDIIAELEFLCFGDVPQTQSRSPDSAPLAAAAAGGAAAAAPADKAGKAKQAPRVKGKRGKADSKGSAAAEERPAAPVKGKGKGKGKEAKGGKEAADTSKLLLEVVWTEAETPAEPESVPIVFSSAAEALLWRVNETLGAEGDKLETAVRDPKLAAALRLLKVMWLLSSEGWRLTGAQPPAQPLVDESDFQSRRVAMKLLTVAWVNAVPCALFGESGLPQWCRLLPRACPFLIPFGARSEYAMFIAGGALRGLLAVCAAKHPTRMIRADVLQPEAMPGEIFPRQTVARGPRMLRTAAEALESTGWRRQKMDIAYEQEEGTGLGPTLEFFTVAGQALQRSGLQLWRGDTGEPAAAGEPGAVDEAAEHVPVPAGGLFPTAPSASTPLSADLALWNLAGRLAGRNLMDGRAADCPVSAAALRLMRCWSRSGEDGWASIADIHSFDEGLARSVQFFVNFAEKFEAASPDERQSLAKEAQLLPTSDFYTWCLPGRDDVELCPGGADKPVVAEEAAQFARACVKSLLWSSVRVRLAAMAEGLADLVPVSVLEVLGDDANQLLGGGESRGPLWTRAEVAAMLACGHGYSQDSTPLELLTTVLVDDFTPQEQRQFLRWATGCPRLPVGGCAAFGKITVVRKTTGGGGEAKELPSCNTCFRYLKLPPYRSREVLAAKLRQAINDGAGSFTLT
eukprot:Hpha_TRINITY_DN2533_c0_g1::TRINITY_DN2533_c0_g1_i1::g.1498::m.1498/K10590/TRIP12; E3 ubiquitin-protein ligase TRIP12